MIKPILIIIMLIASIKLGFAQDHCGGNHSFAQTSEIKTVKGPKTEIRNPSR